MFKIYVACLASYNSGTLHGAWIELDGKDKDEVISEIQEIVLRQSPEPKSEEWEIHDSEGFGFRVEEYHDIEELCDFVQAFRSTGYDQDLIEGLMEYQGIKASEAVEYLNDNYRGCYDSLESYAEDTVSETGDLSEIPKWIQPYIDYAAMGRDLSLAGISSR